MYFIPFSYSYIKTKRKSSGCALTHCGVTSPTQFSATIDIKSIFLGLSMVPLCKFQIIIIIYFFGN